jgi:hypothetical protein
MFFMGKDGVVTGSVTKKRVLRNLGRFGNLHPQVKWGQVFADQGRQVSF